MAVNSVDISAILVSYNTRDLTARAIETLLSCTDGYSLEIWVVDNASTDGSAEMISHRFPQVRLLQNDQNRGFGAANNLALAKAQGRYLLLINSDAFSHPGALHAMAQRLEGDAAIALVGPRLLNEDGSLQQSCFAFPSPAHAWCENLWLNRLRGNDRRIANLSAWPHDTPREVDWVSGACFLLRREVYERLGGFDERFFMYSEETDWQRRMRCQGLRIAFEPTAVVTHLGARSSGPAETLNPHFFDSLDYYELKHHGWAGLISFRMAMVTGCALRLILWTGVWLLRPNQRREAGAKARMHAQLSWRQLTHWPVQKLNRRCRPVSQGIASSTPG